jgi:hypothetical protein
MNPNLAVIPGVGPLARRRPISARRSARDDRDGGRVARPCLGGLHGPGCRPAGYDILHFRPVCWFTVKWRNRGWETRWSAQGNRWDRFAALVPIPKGKTGRHRAAPLRSWPLSRRSGRVATEPYPPPRPSLIIRPSDGPGNGAVAISPPDSSRRGRPFSVGVPHPACGPAPGGSPGRGRTAYPRERRSRSHCASGLRCNGPRTP